MKIKSSKCLKDILIRKLFINNFRISSLIICPKNDLFLTTSHDNSMRLWDLAAGT